MNNYDPHRDVMEGINYKDKNNSCRYIIHYLTDFSDEKNALNNKLFESLFTNDNNSIENNTIISILNLICDSKSYFKHSNSQNGIDKDCLKMLKRFLEYHFKNSNENKVYIFLTKMIDIAFTLKYIKFIDYLINASIIPSDKIKKFVKKYIAGDIYHGSITPLYSIGTSNSYYIFKKYLNGDEIYENTLNLTYLNYAIMNREYELLKVLMEKNIPYNNPSSSMNNYFYIRLKEDPTSNFTHHVSTQYINTLIPDKREQMIQNYIYSFCTFIEENNIKSVVFALDNYSQHSNILVNGLTHSNVPMIGRSKSIEMTQLLLKRGALINSDNIDDRIVYNRIINFIDINSIPILLDNGYYVDMSEVFFKRQQIVKSYVAEYKTRLYNRLKNKNMTNDLIKHTLTFV